MLFFVHAVDDVSGEQLMLMTSPAMEDLMWIAADVWRSPCRDSRFLEKARMADADDAGSTVGKSDRSWQKGGPLMLMMLVSFGG